MLYFGEAEMENLRNFGKRLIKEEDAQGATEYILLLVAVVGVVLLFKDNILTQVRGLLSKLEGNINQIGQ